MRLRGYIGNGGRWNEVVVEQQRSNVGYGEIEDAWKARVIKRRYDELIARKGNTRH